MRAKLLFAALLGIAAVSYAQDPKPYQTGKLSQADSSACQGKSQCQQYILESDSVVFHIRPKHQKQTMSLVDAQRAEFRIQNGNIMLRTEGVDSKEREYLVVSISPRTESNSADATPVRLNHLQ